MIYILVICYNETSILYYSVLKTESKNLVGESNTGEFCQMFLFVPKEIIISVMEETRTSSFVSPYSLEAEQAYDFMNMGYLP